MESLCVFRFEDFFEPSDKIEEGADFNECVLQHIKGEKSYFYSYGTHLLSCMAKYYHYPKADEEYSLSIATGVSRYLGFYAGGFFNIEDAKAYYNSPNFPADYPSIEDGEILMEHKLEAVHYKFGYEVYFLVMLSALAFHADTASFGDKDKDYYIKQAIRVMRKHKDLLKEYKVDKISVDDIKIAQEILYMHYKYDTYACSIEDILKMPVWASTFEAEKNRNNTLFTLYSDMNIKQRSLKRLVNKMRKAG